MISLRKHDRGFTLLELAVVLVIVSVLIGMAMTSGVAVIESARSQQTLSKITTIKQALYTYRATHNRLPCPASLTLLRASSNFGVEGPKGASCWDATAGNATASLKTSDASTVEGAVPVRTLGLPDDMAFDGWGYRILYSVDVTFTAANGFLSSGPDTLCSKIQVLDGSGASGYRTQHAIYLLLSHGSNGNGAYTRNGVVSNLTNTANTDEQQNCHCNGGTTYDGKYVQKDITEDSTNGNNTFDDIVDYTMRWQMQTIQDVPIATSKQTGVPSGIAAPILNGSPAMNGVLFQNVGDNFSFLPTGNMSPYPPYTANISGFWWSPDNRFLLTTGTAGGNNSSFLMYSVSGQTITQVSALPGMPAPPYYTFGAAWSPDNAYLAVSNLTAPYVYVYKRCGSIFSLLPSPPFPAFVYAATPLTWTPDSKFLISFSYWYVGIYQHGTGDTFTLVPITTLFPGSIQGGGPLAFSSDGVYAIEEGTPSGVTTPFYVYKKSGSVYNSLTTFTLPINSGAGGIANAYTWSPDTHYFAVGQYNGSAPFVYVVTRTGDSFAATPGGLTTPATLSNILSTSWSPDSNYLGVGGYDYSWDNNGIALFKVNGGTFTPLSPITPPTGYPNYAHGFGVQFSN